ncbi:MAG: FG-GAP-like repeat-containing protein [Bacteroidota bacterium]
MKNLLLPLFLFISLLGKSQLSFIEVTDAGLDTLAGSEGIAVGDFNNDGWEDFYVSVPLLQSSNRLCKNMGDGTFQEVALNAGVAVTEPSVASTWGDINNDGFLDLYVSTVNHNDHLFLNNGDETFEEITLSAGIYNNGNTKAVNMADVNNDGHLDIYLSNFLSENALFINQGDNTFTNQIQQSGATDESFSMGNIFFDYDRDGDLDLYLTHDHLVPNILYQNNGEGVFTDVSQASGVNSIGYGMGVDVGDVDNDGWLDIYVTNLFQNVLFKNTGFGSFINISQASMTNDNGMGWGTTFFDFNKDGRVDIYVANESDFFSPHEPNVLYENIGNHFYQKTATEQGISNTDNSYGVACLDYNLDGNIDLLVANRDSGEYLQLFENAEHAGNWIKVKLLGTESNRNGIGAKIELVDDFGRIHLKEVSAGHGWASQNSNILFFGLGDNEIDSAKIYWPSGITQAISFENINTTFTVTEGLPPVEGIHFDFATTSSQNLTLQEKPPIRIFPNPAPEEFYIEIDTRKEAPFTLEIYDVLGQVLFQKKASTHLGKQTLTINKNNLNLTNETTFLFININIGDQSWSKKILSY